MGAAAPSAAAEAEATTVWGGAARLLVFLSGPPDLGPGATVPPPALQQQPQLQSQQGDVDDDVVPPLLAPVARAAARPGRSGSSHEGVARAFYEQAATASAALGVVVDLFAVAERPLGLQVCLLLLLLLLLRGILAAGWGVGHTACVRSACCWARVCSGRPGCRPAFSVPTMIANEGGVPFLTH